MLLRQSESLPYSQQGYYCDVTLKRNLAGLGKTPCFYIWRISLHRQTANPRQISLLNEYNGAFTNPCIMCTVCMCSVRIVCMDHCSSGPA